MMRQERMEADAHERELDAEFQAKQAALAEQEEARTAKRRAKRLKKKVSFPAPCRSRHATQLWQLVARVQELQTA